MSESYFSDRERRPVPRTSEEVDRALWGGIYALLWRGIAANVYAADFPLQCDDGKGIYGTDEAGVLATIRAGIPDLDWSFDQHTVPPTLAVLDLAELMLRHAAEAESVNYHKYFDHHHLRFDRVRGQKRLRSDINRILARNGSAFDLAEDGRVERLVPGSLGELLRRDAPPTRDARLDELLTIAAAKYQAPDPAMRREALEQLWDAFERAKTVLNPDKKVGARALIDAATHGAHRDEAELLETEMRALTAIGNEFAIRHHEVAKVRPSELEVDHLFARMHALLMRLHPALR